MEADWRALDADPDPDPPTKLNPDPQNWESAFGECRK
jgi:hypothetical protein